MWRYLAGGVAALLMTGAGWLLFNGEAHPDALSPAKVGATTIAAAAAAQDPLPADLPAAPDRSREQKRFDRYDKDRDGKITGDEYLVPRRKAFARLDRNGDGRLSFEEWATKTTERFAAADTDRSGAMSPTEFATTAPRRHAKPACRCPDPAPSDD